jgi:site-specific DNA recombinase
MQAVIYCRVSTSEQAQNLSLSTQERLCREYCGREDLRVARVFIERGESAKTINRPEFLELISFCRQQKGRLHAVVVHSLTRFSRNTADHHTVRGLLAGFGIRLHSATERIDDSPMGRFVETMLAGMAQFDNDVRAERTVVGMREAIGRGRWVWKAPLGYRNSRNRLAPSLIPDPESAPLVRQAFELYAEHWRDRRSLLDTLESLGLRTTRGRALTAQSLHNLLRNPVYTGRIRSSMGDEQTGDFEPLVPESLFLRVQSRLLGKTSTPETKRRDHPNFPLRRFVRCGVCRTPFTGSSPRGRSKTYAYYTCRRHCPGICAPKTLLEGQFIDLLESLQPKAEYLKLFRAVVLDCWSDQLKASRDIVARLDTRVEDLERQIRKFHQAFVIEKSIDSESYQEMRDRLRGELTVVKIERSEARIEETDVEGILAFAEHMIGNAAALWINASAADRLALQRAFFPEGLEWDGTGFRTPVTCLAFSQMLESRDPESSLASPTGFEPVFWP